MNDANGCACCGGGGGGCGGCPTVNAIRVDLDFSICTGCFATCYEFGDGGSVSTKRIRDISGSYCVPCGVATAFDLGHSSPFFELYDDFNCAGFPHSEFTSSVAWIEIYANIVSGQWIVDVSIHIGGGGADPISGGHEPDTYKGTAAASCTDSATLAPYAGSDWSCDVGPSFCPPEWGPSTWPQNYYSVNSITVTPNGCTLPVGSSSSSGPFESDSSQSSASSASSLSSASSQSSQSSLSSNSSSSPESLSSASLVSSGGHIIIGGVSSASSQSHSSVFFLPEPEMIRASSQSSSSLLLPKPGIVVSQRKIILPDDPVRKTRASKEVWGPALWSLLHNRPDVYDGIPSLELKWLERQFRRTIPCGECRDHWDRLYLLHPPDLSSDETYFAWTVAMHNEVNKFVKKPVMRLEDAKEKYGRNR